MKVVTDSAADLIQSDADDLDITVAPLFIQFPEGEVDSKDITIDDFYQRLKSMAPRIPTTAQPSPGIFKRIYQEMIDKGEEVISVHISSGLSGTIGAARTGADQLPPTSVELVDSLTLSGGQRFQVLVAARGAKAGIARGQIIEKLAKIREATEVVFTLDTLEYLQHGGRIGRIQALAGALLHVKPIIHVAKSDGKYSNLGRERTIPKALDAIISYMSKTYGSETPLWVSIIHGQFSEQAQILSELARQKVNVKKLEILRLSPVLGVHTGPGIVGMAVVPMQLMEA